MKLSDNDKFPIFEIYHNDIKIIINIVCYMGDKETNFILDSISAKIYVSMKITIILSIIMMICIS